MTDKYKWDENNFPKTEMEYFPYDLYDNQVVWQTVKKKDTQSVWVSFKKEALITAIQDLGKPALELYLFLGANVDGFTKGLSPNSIKNEIGISESSYRRGIAELKEKRYLVYSGKQVLSKNNKIAPKWLFYLEPRPPVSKNDIS